MLQKLQHAKFLILLNISLSFLKIIMIKLFISPTDETEIISCITSLNSNKSSGPYSITIKILQLIALNHCHK